ncbi:MAG: SDR family NAD(P)-dependent oxidoreductase [Steroidobacteraceae bacterium]
MTNTKTRVAVITGAAGGIGAACAVRLAKDGFDIVIADIKPADATLNRVREAGRRGEALPCDITQPANVEKLRTLVAGHFGRCDVLINNTGFYGFTPFDSLTFEEWRRYMSVNLDSAFLMCKAFVPFMREQGYGRIIGMASNSYYSNVPGLTAYVATKGALIGLIRGLASDLGISGITANMVAPGPILTEQVRASLSSGSEADREMAVAGFFAKIAETQAVKRTGMPGDVADVVSFLAGESSSFITGQTIVVDGGCVRL